MKKKSAPFCGGGVLHDAGYLVRDRDDDLDLGRKRGAGGSREMERGVPWLGEHERRGCRIYPRYEHGEGGLDPGLGHPVKRPGTTLSERNTRLRRG